WQADSNGIFSSCTGADPGFSGWGRARTDAEGWNKIRTVFPGSYGDRCPHANLMILAIGLTRRLVTTVFFADNPETVRDPVLDCVTDRGARARMFARAEKGDLAVYRLDVV